MERSSKRPEHDTDQRERKREHGVWQLHQVGVRDDARRAAEGLPFPNARRAQRIPNLGHRASTRCFVAPSISITFGQSRVNPSSGSLRVPSSPIFDP